ncbi:glycosyltransferase family 2 protein [Methylocella tundrae]|uniref:glycosyltransferase family 2 protein n=1 Tax=Methylocella tundrae TaxID=227605 RepID=UPI001FCF0CB2|nr:glycosyltransferase [Methylocella tundrae]
MTCSLRLAVGIATAGRTAILNDMLRGLARQARQPDKVFVCPASEQDFDMTQAATLPYPIERVRGLRGSCAQRNAIIDVSKGFDVLVFFDDDFFASRDFLAEVERCFLTQPTTVAASGRVIADGIKGPGLDVAAAHAALASHESLRSGAGSVEQYNAYGCNMAVRLAAVHALNLRFDENLPLYGWLEDVDFCRRLACRGRIIKNEHMIGVHLGHKGGRSTGLRLGYSQIANPIYLWRKGTFRLDLALRQMGMNLAANFGKVLRPEPWIDRRGRVRGNVLALIDLMRGRLDPRRVLYLS